MPHWPPVYRPQPAPQPHPHVPDAGEEPETEKEQPLAPSGPEHETEADIIPPKPDDGSGGGPVSATPNQPPIFDPFGRTQDPERIKIKN